MATIITDEGDVEAQMVQAYTRHDIEVSTWIMLDDDEPWTEEAIYTEATDRLDQWLNLAPVAGLIVDLGACTAQSYTTEEI